MTTTKMTTSMIKHIKKIFFVLVLLSTHFEGLSEIPDARLFLKPSDAHYKLFSFVKVLDMYSNLNIHLQTLIDTQKYLLGFHYTKTICIRRAANMV